MSSAWQDLRHAFRNLIGNPRFAIVAVLTVALGIGANTAIFSVLHAVVLMPLPFAEPERLVAVWETESPDEGPRQVSYPNFFDWRERSGTLDSLAVFRSERDTLTTQDGSERLEVARVTADFLSMLDAPLAMGRNFRPEEDVPGSPAVVILSHGFWQDRYGGSRDVLGQVITLDSVPTEIVGVLGPGFHFPLELSEAALWTPAARDAHYMTQRGMHGVAGLGRLREGVTLAAAQSEMSAIASGLAKAHPDSNEGRGVLLVPLHEQIVGESRGPLFLLLGVVGVVLLIACSNVANLMLARGSGRRREFAVRAALGASRSRLVRHILAESALLGAIGGLAGLLLAVWCTPILQTTLPLLEVPRLTEVAVDATVLGYTLGLSMLTAVVFGLLPALHLSRADLHAGLKQGERGHADAGGRFRSALVVLEVSLALVLLAGAGLLTRSFIELLRVDPGFRYENALTFRVLADEDRHPGADAKADFYHEILQRVETLPDVIAAGASTTVPLVGGSWTTGFKVISRPELGGDDGIGFRYYSSTPGYFEAMGIPLLDGRLFTERDRRGRPGAVIINDTMARSYWGDGSPLGERMTFGINFGEEDEPREWEIVGVVGDVRHSSLDGNVMPQIYVPYRQQTNSTMHFVIRTAGDPRDTLPAVRAQIAALDREAPLYLVRTLEEARNGSAASRRSAMLLLGGFAALAILLAAVGLYGLISFSVMQRTREIGVRLSLGARVRDIMWIVLGQGMALALLGVALGLAGALAATRLVAGILYGISPTDPATLVAVSVLLLLVALSACLIPALRALRVDPMVALRCE